MTAGSTASAVAEARTMTRPVLIGGSMLLLAGLDMVGALLAQRYADGHRPYAFVLGVLTFVVLFVVYALALQLAQLSVVTMGWIVLLQVGLVMIDVGRRSVTLDARQWAAIAVVLLLQCYLVASTEGEPPAPPRVPEQRRPVDAVRPPDAPTPYLDLSLDVVADAYDELAAALPGVRLHYAVKANPAPEVLDTLVRRGAAFDVASPAEVAASLAAGAHPADLSYGNTAKKARDIASAYAAGVRAFSFDSAAELDKLVREAPGAMLCCRLATSGHGADWALSEKFGCPPEQAAALLLRAAALGHPVGVAFHVGSQQRDPGQWEQPLRAAGALQSRLRAAGVELAVVNIGGGFPATYRTAVPPAADYGAAILAAAGRHLAAPLPRLVAEPGRAVVAAAGTLTSEVVLVAQRDGRRWVHLDIGLFGGLAEALGEAITFWLETDRDGGPTGPVVLAGPTCDSVDVLYRDADYRLPLDLVAGDRVRLHATGAYTATYASVGFNGLAPLAIRVHGHVRSEVPSEELTRVPQHQDPAPAVHRRRHG